MVLPKYHETFIPILRVLADHGVLSMGELKQKVRDTFYSDLPHELSAMTTKVGYPLILNRIGWGKAYLKIGGFIEQPERGVVKITAKGQDALKKGSLSLNDVLHDPDFIAYKARSIPSPSPAPVDEDASPQDLIDSGVHEIEEQVKADLLAKLKKIDPYYFQIVILRLLEKMGYGDFIEMPKSGDGGIDGIMKQDALGLDKIYIQAKRYTDSKVREGEMRNFIGAMSSATTKGIYVTTSTFDDRALEKAKNAGHKIITIDGQALVDLMYKYDIGVQISERYEVKQIDDDFFEEA